MSDRDPVVVPNHKRDLATFIGIATVFMRRVVETAKCGPPLQMMYSIPDANIMVDAVVET